MPPTGPGRNVKRECQHSPTVNAAIQICMVYCWLGGAKRVQSGLYSGGASEVRKADL